ncbi:NAD(P)-dependent dehydrogenase (short-subunit alcohol dehydrogenase family) [Paenibacillus sp. SORGH_AS338]|uniref:SDR family NAD(P)-dependent oxidoreductase n=1 Tax=Paenibacillus sp. SORGH_AS_0338 TaxID=3041755 RepID=UPI0028567703|nr:SDR family NAD(P)-dependent oxidoreductase [Paenibacillus sp. SORGH_AS_0338]MDR6111346.1 NAD(P)-dependent dehydrogenase (short-subunit alcohol dehydrogenase family) [Paenibacillus sp. SORGH_AS_0338]
MEHAYTQTPQHNINSGFGHDSTASEVLQGIDLTGKLALVTGGYSGLGLETTRALVQAGAHVIVPARRPDVAREALKGLEHVEVDELDLSDLDSVRAFAGRLVESWTQY